MCKISTTPFFIPEPWLLHYNFNLSSVNTGNIFIKDSDISLTYISLYFHSNISVLPTFRQFCQYHIFWGVFFLSSTQLQDFSFSTIYMLLCQAARKSQEPMSLMVYLMIRSFLYFFLFTHRKLSPEEMTPSSISPLHPPGRLD